MVLLSFIFHPDAPLSTHWISLVQTGTQQKQQKTDHCELYTQNIQEVPQYLLVYICMINRAHLFISLILNSFKYTGPGQNSCVDNLYLQMSLAQLALISLSFSTFLQSIIEICLLRRSSTSLEPVTFNRLFTSFSHFCKVQFTHPRINKQIIVIIIIGSGRQQWWWI